MPDFLYDLFISYSHHDAAWVRGWLLPRLEEAGLRVCIDFRDFDIGVPSLVNMERAVDNSRHTLIVLTSAWVASEWAEFESLLAGTADPAGRRRKLIPLMLKSCELPSRIAMLTYADFTQLQEREAQLKRVVAATRPELRSPLPESPRFWRVVEFGSKWNELVQGLRESYRHTPEYQELYQLVQNIQAKLGRTCREDERFDRTKDWQEGIVLLGRLSSFDSRNPELQSLLTAMKFELARLFFEAAKKKFYYQRRWRETSILIKQALALNRNYSEALQIETESREALEREEREKEKFYEEAVKYLQREQWKEAAGLLEHICLIDPDYRDTKMLLAICNQGKEA